MKIQGKSILEHIIDFLRYSKFTDQIIIATSNLPEDDKIANLLNDLGVGCYRGSPDDVLARYYGCAKFFKGDIIVRVTADNPLTNPELIDEVVTLCKKTKCEYATNVLHPTYPTGIYGEALTFSTLTKIHETKKDPLSREHVTHDMLMNPHQYHIEEVFAPAGFARPMWRLTVDYIEDLYLMQKIFSELYIPNSYIDYKRLVEFLDKNKELFKINEIHNE